jgi:hypothetical protein
MYYYPIYDKIIQNQMFYDEIYNSTKDIDKLPATDALNVELLYYLHSACRCKILITQS